MASQIELKTSTTAGSSSALLTSLAALSTKVETFATSRVRSQNSFDTFCTGTLLPLLPESIAAKEGPSGTFLFKDPERSLPGVTGDGSRSGANLFGIKNVFCGDCIRSASLALIGKGIFLYLLLQVESYLIKSPIQQK
jgi:hypothetical protein